MGKLCTMFRIEAKADHTEIDIFGDIGESWFSEGHTIQSVKNQIKGIKGNIVVNLSSLGGSVNHGLGIHDILSAHKGHVTVKIIGATASSGTIVAMAGSKIEMSENALFLVHNAWTYTLGNADELRKQAEDLDKFDDRLVHIYTSKTGKSEEEIRSLMKEDRWIDANEALEYGFVDEVYQSLQAAASVDRTRLVKAGLPDLPQNYGKSIPTHMENNEKTIQEKVLGALGFKSNDALKAENESLKEKINGYADYDSLKAKAESAEASISGLNEAIAAKDTEISGLNTKINDLNASVEAKDNEIAALQDEVARLKTGEGSGAKGGNADPSGKQTTPAKENRFQPKSIAARVAMLVTGSEIEINPEITE